MPGSASRNGPADCTQIFVTHVAAKLHPATTDTLADRNTCLQLGAHTRPALQVALIRIGKLNSFPPFQMERTCFTKPVPPCQSPIATPTTFDPPFSPVSTRCICARPLQAPMATAITPAPGRTSFSFFLFSQIVHVASAACTYKVRPLSSSVDNQESGDKVREGECVGGGTGNSAGKALGLRGVTLCGSS